MAQTSAARTGSAGIKECEPTGKAAMMPQSNESVFDDMPPKRGLHQTEQSHPFEHHSQGGTDAGDDATHT